MQDFVGYKNIGFLVSHKMLGNASGMAIFSNKKTFTKNGLK